MLKYKNIKKVIFKFIIIGFLLLFSWTTGISSPAVIILNYSLIIFVLLDLIYLEKHIKILKEHKILLFFSIIILLSLFWSHLRPVTLANIIKYIVYTSFGFLITIKFAKDEIYKLLKSFFGFSMISSLIVVGLFPEIFVDQSIYHYGSWIGIFAGKNFLGTIASLAVISFYISFFKESKSLFNFLLLLLSSIVLYQSNSISALVITLIVIVSLVFIEIYSSMRFLTAKLFVISSTILLLFVSSLLLYNNYEFLMYSLGRDPTLTGRSSIYSSTINSIKALPFLGYGFGGYWGTFESLQVQSQIGFNLSSSHSGIIDIALDLGLIGLFVIFVMLIKNLVKSYVFLKLNFYNPHAWFYFAFAIFIIAYNIFDSRLLNTSGILWIIFIISLVGTNRESYHKF